MMPLGEFGSFSSPEIDRESDMLREIEAGMTEIASLRAENAKLRAVLQDIAANGADMGGAWCAAQATKPLSE
jgi:hypothetical protein